MATYAGFHKLPAGIKRMLLASEDIFFREAKSITVRIGIGGLMETNMNEAIKRVEFVKGPPGFGPCW